MSNVKSVLVFGAGFVGGWAARSLADTPQGVGVKLLEVAINAKERVGRWATLEGERLEDMLAEARARVELQPAETNGVANGAGHAARTKSEEA
jgi:nucleoside-diphosphate-sugar epimerase